MCYKSTDPYFKDVAESACQPSTVMDQLCLYGYCSQYSLPWAMVQCLSCFPVLLILMQRPKRKT